MAQSFANATSLMSKRIAVWDLIEQDASTSGGTVAVWETLLAAISSYEWSQDIRADVQAEREAIAGIVDGESVQAALEDALREVAGSTEISSEETKEGDVFALQRAVYDYMAGSAAQTVLRRNQTYGTPSAGGGNVGNGSVIRLTVDENGHNLEGWFADDYTLKCVEDGRTTGEEEDAFFELSGTAQGSDELSRAGAPVTAERIKSLNARDSQAYIQNPSFSSFTGTAGSSPTAVAGWSVASAWSNFTINQTETYRPEPGAGTNKSTSLRFDANDTISQPLSTVNAQIDYDLPFIIGFATYKPTGLTAGTLTARLASGLSGGVSVAVDVSAQTNDTWARNWLVATPGQNNWPRNFNANTLTLSFAATLIAGASFSLDDIIFAPMTRVGGADDPRTGRGAMGQYIAIDGGSTPWVEGDSYTWTDSETRGPKNQYWTAVAGLGYYPSAASPTVADA